MVVCYYGDSLEICLWRERKREQSLQGWIIDDVVKQIQWYSSSSFIQYFTSQVIAFYGRRARGPLLIPQLSLFEKPQIWRKKKVLCITRGNAAAATGNREADDLLLDEALCGFITHPLICTKDFATSNLWISSKAQWAGSTTFAFAVPGRLSKFPKSTKSSTVSPFFALLNWQ